MTEFEQRKRECFIKEDDYDAHMNFADKMLASDNFKADRSAVKAKFEYDYACRFSFSRVKFMAENIWMRYSVGDAIDVLAGQTQRLFDDLALHRAAFPEHKLKISEPDNYYLALMFLSWAVLFRLSDNLDILADFINPAPPDTCDSLVNAFFATLLMECRPDGDTHLLHPEPYGIIREALQTENKELQEASIGKYLRSWYKSPAIKSCYWHGWHTHENNTRHLGYWAFETGLMTVLYQLDDKAYRGLNFYPADLVDFCGGNER